MLALYAFVAATLLAGAAPFDYVGGSSVPSGAILLVNSGSCPAEYTEESSLNGKTLLGTLNAGADVGTTGGNDNITPAGTVSQPSFTGDASTVVVNHVHVQNVNTGTTGGQNGYGVDTSTNGSGATGLSTANATGGAANYTPAGTVSQPTFTGTQFDNRSAWQKVIFCKKN